MPPLLKNSSNSSHYIPLRKYISNIKNFSPCRIAGAPDFNQDILINGASFKVTATLEKALKVCCARGLLTVWVGQICINQADVDEQNCQIQLSRKIYSLTNAIFAFIEDEGPSPRTGITFVEDYFKRWRKADTAGMAGERKVWI
jgi:hypothetical protein